VGVEGRELDASRSFLSPTFKVAAFLVDSPSPIMSGVGGMAQETFADGHTEIQVLQSAFDLGPDLPVGFLLTVLYLPDRLW
jgi:hypothetical protein